MFYLPVHRFFPLPLLFCYWALPLSLYFSVFLSLLFILTASFSFKIHMWLYFFVSISVMFIIAHWNIFNGAALKSCLIILTYLLSQCCLFSFSLRYFCLLVWGMIFNWNWTFLYSVIWFWILFKHSVIIEFFWHCSSRGRGPSPSLFLPDRSKRPGSSLGLHLPLWDR